MESQRCNRRGGVGAGRTAGICINAAGLCVSTKGRVQGLLGHKSNRNEEEMVRTRRESTHLHYGLLTLSYLREMPELWTVVWRICWCVFSWA